MAKRLQKAWQGEGEGTSRERKTSDPDASRYKSIEVKPEEPSAQQRLAAIAKQPAPTTVTSETPTRNVTTAVTSESDCAAPNRPATSTSAIKSTKVETLTVESELEDDDDDDDWDDDPFTKRIFGECAACRLVYHDKNLAQNVTRGYEMRPQCHEEIHGDDRDWEDDFEDI